MTIENNTLIEVDNYNIVKGKFIFPKNIKHIDDWAFINCSNLTSMIIPDGVISIGKGAFWGCNNLKRIKIPNGVTSIGYRVFDSCTSLTSIKIPNSVTYIGESVFEYCDNLISKKSNYKAFDLKDNELYCRNKKYIEGVRNSVEGRLKMCKNGIHYCTNLFEIFNYYYGELDKDIAIYEIEIGDKVLTSKSSKCCTNSCVLKKRLYKEDIIKILSGGEI